MDLLVQDVIRFARIYRHIGSTRVADLLENAATKIGAGEHDPEIAAELRACAASKEHASVHRQFSRVLSDAAEALDKRKAADQ